MLEYVPTAPDILTTPTAALARRSRSRDRATANAKSATRCPHVSGSPWMPWVRPTRSVSRCRSAWSRRVATSMSARSSSWSLASVSRIASAVSLRSWEVMPKCTYAAASRGWVLSAHAVRKAITSCWVTSSTLATAAAVGGLAFRTGSTTQSGTAPDNACASSASVSTRHHTSYRCWSDQMRPISGRVYRSITPPSSQVRPSHVQVGLLGEGDEVLVRHRLPGPGRLVRPALRSCLVHAPVPHPEQHRGAVRPVHLHPPVPHAAVGVVRTVLIPHHPGAVGVGAGFAGG